MSVLAALILGLARSDTPKIEVSTPEFAAQYCALRFYASEKSVEALKGFEAGAKLLRDLDASLPDSITLRSGERKAKSPTDRRIKDLYWSLLDSQVLSAGSLADLKERIAMMPPTLGGYLNSGRAFAAIQSALESTKGVSIDKSTVDRRLAEWQTGAVPKFDAIYGFLTESLQVKKLPARVRVIVVPLLAGKGGITLRTMDGPLVVIGCNRFEGADFDEVLIHETIHALDAIEGNVGLFATVRHDLADAKVETAVIEQIVHTMIFMHAAESVRRSIAADHHDVGDSFGIYKSGVQKYVDLLREPLRKLWAKQMTDKELAKTLAKQLL